MLSCESHTCKNRSYSSILLNSLFLSGFLLRKYSWSIFKDWSVYLLVCSKVNLFIKPDNHRNLFHTVSLKAAGFSCPRLPSDVDENIVLVFKEFTIMYRKTGLNLQCSTLPNCPGDGVIEVLWTHGGRECGSQEQLPTRGKVQS